MYLNTDVVVAANESESEHDKQVEQQRWDLALIRFLDFFDWTGSAQVTNALRRCQHVDQLLVVFWLQTVFKLASYLEGR